MTVVLGIDIGGTHLKAAPVDVHDGELVEPPEWIETPRPATPAALLAVISEFADNFSWSGPIGIGFPGVVDANVVRTAAHLDRSCIGVDLSQLVSDELGLAVTAINDADAAALAEVHFGAGRGHPGVVLTITLGTGVGSGMTIDGILVPNTELGHLQQGGSDMEARVAARAHREGDSEWESWGREVDAYLHSLENLLWPALFIIGGGISADFEKFERYLRLRTPIAAATKGNDAGIIGAALAHQFHAHPPTTHHMLPDR